MSPAFVKPVIFISYSHKDEPELAAEGEIHWLTDIQSYLAPAANGIFDLWNDEEIAGGADWEEQIKTKLASCDICILFLSRHSLASKYVIEVEIEAIRQRQRLGQSVQIYPIVLSPFPRSAIPSSLLALNLRPRLDKPLSGLSRHERGVEISKIADEIVGILGATATSIVPLKPGPLTQPFCVHITRLPETGYERLVGREAELKCLNAAWADAKTNIVSLVAEGGAGKSALVNDWLKRLQADNYGGAEAVLGWSFYSQGTKERATSADEFLNWALDKLGITLATTSASTKAEAIAEAMMRRRVLLLLDGAEPLQHGPSPQLGQLKDFGLRALLRRFATTPPGASHGLVVLTSRLAVKDIARWRDGPAPVVNVERLSDQSGAALLRDNGVWGTDKELNAAASDFEGHPLALDLLASFLKETQTGDVRRRDHIRGYFADPNNPRHDHAKRVMESIEKDWLSGQPVLSEIMYIISLFDRPASESCLNTLRAKPTILGLTNSIVGLSDDEWNRAVFRLRTVRLIAPIDPSSPGALDAHPLVRDWFAERLEKHNRKAWRSAHGRLLEYLRDNTWESDEPTLEELGPLYQAVVHGCHAGRHSEALAQVYRARICRRRIDNSLEFYSQHALGAFSSDLAAMSRFFEKPYEVPLSTLNRPDQAGVLSLAASCLRAQGRLTEALAAQRGSIKRAQEPAPRSSAKPQRPLQNFATGFAGLSEIELALGEIGPAIVSAAEGVKYADLTGLKGDMINKRMTLANAMDAAGKSEKADALAAEATILQKEFQPEYGVLHSISGYFYCNLLLGRGDWRGAFDHVARMREGRNEKGHTVPTALGLLAECRAHLGLALNQYWCTAAGISYDEALSSYARFDKTVEELRSTNHALHIPRGLLARASFRRSVGDWDGGARDLDEVEEVAEPGSMRLFLCDMALERVRLALAKIEAFSPLKRLIDDSPLKPQPPDKTGRNCLHEEAARQLEIAAGYVKTCGYHRRDEELTELQGALRGEHTFASLPPRV